MSKTTEQKRDEQSKRSYTSPRLETRGKLQLVSGVMGSGNYQ